MESKRRSSLLAAIVLVAMVAVGPVVGTASGEDSSMAFEIEVTDQGEVEAIELTWEVDAETYDAWRKETSEQGYDDVAQAFAEELARRDPGFDAATGEDRELEDGYALVMEFTEIDMDEAEATEVTVEDGTVTYRLFDVDDPADDPSVGTVTYRIVMPGEVTDANADEVDGNVATWTLEDGAPEELFVQSDGEPDEGLPGFGVPAALAALLAVAGALAGRRR